MLLSQVAPACELDVWVQPISDEEAARKADELRLLQPQRQDLSVADGDESEPPSPPTPPPPPPPPPEPEPLTVADLMEPLKPFECLIVGSSPLDVSSTSAPHDRLAARTCGRSARRSTRVYSVLHVRVPRHAAWASPC